VIVKIFKRKSGKDVDGFQRVSCRKGGAIDRCPVGNGKRLREERAGDRLTRRAVEEDVRWHFAKRVVKK